MSTRAMKGKGGLTTREALEITNKAADQAVEALVLTRKEVAKIPKQPPPTRAKTRTTFGSGDSGS